MTLTCLTALLVGLTTVARPLRASETGVGHLLGMTHRGPVRRALMLDGMTLDLAQGMTLDLAQGMTLDHQCLWCMSLTGTGMTTGTGMAGRGLTRTGLTGHGLTGTGLSRTRLIGTTAKAGRSMVAEATALSIGHSMTTIGGLGRRV